MEAIDKIRKVTNLVEIAAEFTKLKKKAEKMIGKCPFCTAKDAFVVDGKKQIYHCYGCGVGGDVFTFIMEKLNKSFPEALKWLQEKYGVEIESQNIEYDNLMRRVQRKAGQFRTCFDSWLGDGIKDKKFIYTMMKFMSDLENIDCEEDIPF